MITVQGAGDAVSVFETEQGKAAIAVIDGHPLIREGLKTMINQQQDLRCCWTAGTPFEALEALQAYKPQVVVLDLLLRTGDSLELLEIILQRQPGLKVVMLSQQDDSFYNKAVSVESALRAGAFGFVPKETAVDCLLTAIRRVLAGQFYVPRGIAARLLGTLALTRGKGLSKGMEHLTDRELEVLFLIGGGMSTREAAGQLQLSLKTVETYRENLKSKLALAGAPELIRFAAKWVQEYVTVPRCEAEDLGCHQV